MTSKSKQPASRTQQVIREAGEKAINYLLADEAFTAHVADVAIQQAINAGRLIPAERLQLGPGLTLVSTERLVLLDDGVAKAIGLLEKKSGPDVDGALIALHAAQSPPQTTPTPPTTAPQPVPAPDTPSDTSDTPDDATDATGDEEEPPKKKRKGRTASKIPVDDDGRPHGMPDPDTDHECEKCGETVPGVEAQIRWIKTRNIICESCMKK